jgi:hypothetical protein
MIWAQAHFNTTSGIVPAGRVASCARRPGGGRLIGLGVAGRAETIGGALIKAYDRLTQHPARRGRVADENVPKAMPGTCRPSRRRQYRDRTRQTSAIGARTPPGAPVAQTAGTARASDTVSSGNRTLN